jgi:hypothetical protein
MGRRNGATSLLAESEKSKSAGNPFDFLAIRRQLATQHAFSLSWSKACMGLVAHWASTKCWRLRARRRCLGRLKQQIGVAYDLEGYVTFLTKEPGCTCHGEKNRHSTRKMKRGNSSH